MIAEGKEKRVLKHFRRSIFGKPLAIGCGAGGEGV
jgi:hypothetical protein